MVEQQVHVTGTFILYIRFFIAQSMVCPGETSQIGQTGVS